MYMQAKLYLVTGIRSLNMQLEYQFRGLPDGEKFFKLRELNDF